MKTVTVNASRKYDILIGEGLLAQLGQHITALGKAGKAAVISDSNVWSLYGQSAVQSLTEAGFQVICYSFPAGESSKNAEIYLKILNFLAENKMTRSDVLIALGGGVTGDMVGFAAATYLRGITYVQVPTSLLAMVDSSVGGKTAIDLPAGKNLVGAFYQPSLVLCDTATLNTLPENIFRDGCAEVIKYGVLYDENLFFHLQNHGPAFDRNYVIARCVELKRDVVMEDEFDTGARQKLNLGHTIGHAIEAQSNYSITHGQAVAIGMAMVTKAAIRQGFCSESIYLRLLTVLEEFSLPTSASFPPSQLCHSALSDKKRTGGTVNLIIPRAIGDCIIHSLPVTELEDFIKAGSI